MSKSDLLRAIQFQNDCTPSEAMAIIKEMAELILEGENPEDLLFDEGLEPDYVLALLEFAYN